MRRKYRSRYGAAKALNELNVVGLNYKRARSSGEVLLGTKNLLSSWPSCGFPPYLMIREGLKAATAAPGPTPGYWTTQEPEPPRPVSSAFFARTIPKPYELSRPGAPLSRAVFVSALRICWFVFVGWQLQMSAATADT